MAGKITLCLLVNMVAALEFIQAPSIALHPVSKLAPSELLNWNDVTTI